MGFDNIVPIEIWHLSIRLHPHLILRMLGDMVERRNVEFELPGFGEFPKTCAKREKVITSDGGSKLRNGLADVVDSVTLDTEAVWVIGAVN